MVCSFDKEKLLKRFDALEGIDLPRGRTLWYPRDMFFHVALFAFGVLVSACLLILIALCILAGTVFVETYL